MGDKIEQRRKGLRYLTDHPIRVVREEPTKYPYLRFDDNGPVQLVNDRSGGPGLVGVPKGDEAKRFDVVIPPLVAGDRDYVKRVNDFYGSEGPQYRELDDGEELPAFVPKRRTGICESALKEFGRRHPGLVRGFEDDK